MTDLTTAGHVEDAGAPPPELSERERERYGRGMTLSRWMDLRPRESAWKPQLLLRRAGSCWSASAAPARPPPGTWWRPGWGGCTVSNRTSSNCPISLFREADLGTPKIDAALSALHALNSDTTVTGERREVRGPSDLEDLLAGGAPRYDLVLLAADRPPVIRRWADRVCLASGVPWAGAGYRGPLVGVGVFTPGRGACRECLRSAEIERRDLRLAPGQDEEAASPRMPWNPVNAVTAGRSGGLLAHAAIALLCGIPPVEPGCRFGLDLMVPGEAIMQRRPDCPACGTWTPRTPVTGGQPSHA